MTTNWKNELLKSGLPFEYEVQECFVKNGCTVWGEATYLREDEEEKVKEFSYDIDANYWKGGYCLNFMIECKYKIQPTKWFFLPHQYKYQNDLDKNGFFHPLDYFSDHSFPFNKFPVSDAFENLGPFCLKGVELFENQYLEQNIRKSIHQLSYSFVNRSIECFENQLTVDTFKNSIFLNVPIVVTNADLHLINENATIEQIESANSIEDVSTKQNFLFFFNKIGMQLKEYNKLKLKKYFQSIDSKLILESKTNDIDLFIEYFSSNFCPQVILFMQHTKDAKNYSTLFNYINQVLEPDKDTQKKIDIVCKSFEERCKDFGKKVKKQNGK